jgi:hypothetical protein
MNLGKKFSIAFLAIVFLQPVNASAASNGDIAEALTYSGCTWGLILEPGKFNMEQTVKGSVEFGLQFRLIDEGISVSPLEKIDTPRARKGYDHFLQSWSTAGVLNSKWKPLESTYEKGMQAGLKNWNSGKSFGVSGKAATAIAAPKLVALCRVAEIGVKTKALKAKLSTRKYVIKVTGSYLPPLPSVVK